LGIATAGAALILCAVGYRYGNLWAGFNGETFWVGAARVNFSFLAGLLVYRCGLVIKNRFGFFLLALLLVFALVMPYAKGGWIREAAVMIIYFPLLVMLGAGATLGEGSKKFCKLAGEISYPLYMTHYAVIYVFGNYYDKTHPGPAELALVVIGGVIAMVGFAYLVMKFYDIPLRAHLSRRKTGRASGEIGRTAG